MFVIATVNNVKEIPCTDGEQIIRRYLSGKAPVLDMRNGLKKNGNMRYHICPIREAVEWYPQHQLYLAEAAAERHRVQRKLSAQAAEPPCSPL